MRVVQLVPEMSQGGVERGVVEENRAFVKTGTVDNWVVARTGDLLEQIVQDGGHALRLDVKSKNPLTFFSRARKLRLAYESIKPDLVVVHSRVPGWLHLYANRKLRIPTIAFPHGLNSPGRYSRIMTRGDLIMTPSKAVAEHIMHHYGVCESKIRIIPRAIDRDKFDTSNLDTAFIAAKRLEWGLEGRYTVMGLGRITQLKGYDTLLRAAAIAVKRIPELKVVIVGEAEELRREYFEELLKLRASLGLDETVVFAGRQTKAAECLSMADVVVSSNTRKPEAFGRSMAEALAMGKPVVAVRFGGALDIVEDGVNGVFVDVVKDGPRADALRAEKLAEAILKVRAMHFGDLRTPALEKFSFEKMVSSTLAVYREAVALRTR